jgi:glycosyltransferase A (GT-A) superfamily protein (DUF2064 family)
VTGTASDTTLLVIAKQPVPGRVKTRLVPPCSYQQAAALAEAALADTLNAVLQAPARRRVLVLDGTPGPWLPDGFDVVPQSGGQLDERLADAFAAIQRARLLTAGMRVADLPVLRDVDTAADALAVASQAPRTRFAARVRKLTPVLRPVPVAGPGAIGETA